MSSQENFAQTIRNLRKQHGITQSQLADISGVSLPTISRIERGKETVRLDVLNKLIDCLGYELVIRPIKKP